MSATPSNMLESFLLDLDNLRDEALKNGVVDTYILANMCGDKTSLKTNSISIADSKILVILLLAYFLEKATIDEAAIALSDLSLKVIGYKAMNEINDN